MLVMLPGSGVLLVQNSKMIFLTVEHANPMVVIVIKSGYLNETQFFHGFNNMFN